MSTFFHQTKYFSLKPFPVFKIYTFLCLSPAPLLIHLGTAMDLHRNQDSALLYNIYAFTPCMDHFIMINLIIMHYSTVLLTFLGLIRLWHDTLLLIMIHIFCVYIVRSQSLQCCLCSVEHFIQCHSQSPWEASTNIYFKRDDIEGLELSAPRPCNQEAPH